MMLRLSYTFNVLNQTAMEYQIRNARAHIYRLHAVYSVRLFPATLAMSSAFASRWQFFVSFTLSVSSRGFMISYIEDIFYNIAIAHYRIGHNSIPFASHNLSVQYTHVYTLVGFIICSHCLWVWFDGHVSVNINCKQFSKKRPSQYRQRQQYFSSVSFAFFLLSRCFCRLSWSCPSTNENHRKKLI